MFKKMMNQTVITILRLLGRLKDDYPAGLKYERRESFKALIKRINDSKNDNKK